MAEESQVVVNAASSPDYKSALTRAVLGKTGQQAPQGIFMVPAYNGGFFLKQLRSMGIKLPVFGPDTFAVQEVLDIAKQSAEGVVCANAVVPEHSVGAQKLRQVLKKQYGTEPSSVFYAALGYDGLKIVARAAREPERFAEIMRKAQFPDLVLPVQGFSEQRSAKLQAGLFTINAGKVVPLAE